MVRAVLKGLLAHKLRLVLTAIAAGPWRGRLDAPACLGKPFRPAT